MIHVTVLHGATESAVRAAPDRDAQLAAFLAPWAGGPVDLRYYSAAGLLLDTVRHAAWSINTATDPHQADLGAFTSRTFAAAGVASYAVAAVPSGADIMRAKVSLAGAISALCRTTLAPQAGAAGLVVRPDPTLPSATHALTLAAADTGTAGVDFALSITSSSTGAESWSIAPPEHVSLSTSSGTIAAGATVNLTGQADQAGTYTITLVCPGANISGNPQSIVVAALPPTTATLSGSSTASATQPQTYTVTLDSPADQTYTITPSASNSGVIAPTTRTITAGATTGTFTVTWPVAGSARSVDFTISPALTRAGRPISVEVAAYVPAWRTAMAVNTWAQIPSTTTITSIAPFANTSLRPPGADWIGNGIPFAWTGFAWDDATLTWYAGMLGGHTDYGGNEPYKVSLATESTVWQMIRLPSGAVGTPALTARDGNETDGTGLYSDGRLRAHHTYGNHRFVPGVGLVVARSTGHFVSGTGDAKRIWTIDTTTGEATQRVDYTAFTQMGGGEASVDYDPVRSCLWSMGSSTSTLLQITDLSSATWTATKRGVWDNHMYGSGCLRYVPGADALLLYPTPTGSGLGTINLTTYTQTSPTMSGSFSTGLVTTAAVVIFGMEWCTDLNCFLLWNNTSNTTQISTLTPSNPADATQPWVRGVLTVGGSNTVTPPSAPAGDGVGSRFTYSESLGCVLLQCAANGPIYAFATR